MKKTLAQWWNTLKERSLGLSLNAKQVLVTLACLLPLGLYIFAAARTIYRASRITGVNSVRTAVDSFADSVESEMTMVYRYSVILLRNPEMRRLLQEGLPEGGDLEELTTAKKEALSSTVMVLEDSEYIDKIEIFVQPEREFLADGACFHRIAEIEDRGWYRDLMEGSGKGRWCFAKDEESGEQELFYLTKVVSPGDYRKNTAVARITYSQEHLRQLMSYTLIYPGSLALFCGDQGGAAAVAGEEADLAALSLTGDPEEMPETFSGALKEMAGGVSGTGETVCSVQGRRYRLFLKPLKGPGYGILLAVPDSSFGTLRNAGDYAGIFGGFVLCAGWMLAVMVTYSSSLVKKIHVVSDYVSSIHSSDDVRIMKPFRARDELQMLSDSYNSMARALKQNLEREYMLGLAKRSSDLKALQAQINPHFLYNTLELVDYYAFEQKPEIVEEIVKNLADFYRLSLNNGSDLYSLWKEIRLITAWFDIQRIRWESNFELKIDIPEELGQCQIPPFTLQPLVENAVMHGIRGTKEHGGSVEISAERDGPDIRITVSDDGVGMPDGLVEELNREMDIVSEDTVSGEHYGIQNSNQRLKIVFGPDYGIRIRSVEDEGTVVTVTIPAS